MIESKTPKEVEVAELAAWTTGYSAEQNAVALILRFADGVEFGVVISPTEAMAMGAKLTELGLTFAEAASA